MILRSNIWRIGHFGCSAVYITHETKKIKFFDTKKVHRFPTHIIVGSRRIAICPNERDLFRRQEMLFCRQFDNAARHGATRKQWDADFHQVVAGEDLLVEAKIAFVARHEICLAQAVALVGV